MSGDPKAPGDLRSTVRLFRRFMGRRRVYVAGIVLLVIEAATAIVEPYPIAYLIDFLQGVAPSLAAIGLPVELSADRLATILVLTVAIITIAAINSAADSLTEVCMARGGRSLGYSVRIAMYSHLQRLPLAYHDSKRTGDVLTRVTGDVLVVEEFVANSISNILGSLLVLVGSFAVLFFQSSNVALIALVVIPILAMVSDFFSRRIKTASKTQRSREGELASTAQEMLTSIRLVQSYGRGNVDLERFSDQTSRSMRASLSAANIQAQFSFVIAIAEALAISAVIWLGVWLIDRRALSIGMLVLFVLLMQNMFKPARKIVSEWYKVGKVFASVERIDDLLDRAVGVDNLPTAVPAPRFTGRVTFRHVEFAYPAEHEDGTRKERRPAVLRDIDFEVAPGEVVSLVGSSGAGKSTIAQLIPRLYDPDDGKVLIDRLPVRGLTLTTLRSQISLVLQETMLLSGSVADNIAYGLDDATPNDIQAAARSANAHEFIVALPDGYDTQLGERGATLSGGQRQRLAIARAFIRQTPILILDEPTTGLDSESAEVVVEALRNLMRGKTTIVISHDQALVRCADRVMVVAEGRIVESGTHDELVEAGGAYAELFGADSRVDRREDGRRRTASAIRSTVHATPDQGTGSASSLVERLRHRLPGLGLALDEDVAADRIQQLLLEYDLVVEHASVGKIWLRADRTCNLRYQVQLSDGSEHSVLARVHAQAADAARYLERSVRPFIPATDERIGATRWREPAALWPEAAAVLHPFPLDPALPTLARATDPRVIRRLARDGSVPDAEPIVEVVHHPREGACVLRFRYPEVDGPDATDDESVLYGKVYSDARGEIVEGLLRALDGGRATGDAAEHARFPMPVLYDRRLRLLMTAGLPGQALVPRLLKTALGSGTGEATDGDLAALLLSVRASGRGLAMLHDSDLATAPVHSGATEVAGLQDHLRVVERLWPETEIVRRHVAALAHEIGDLPDTVLSHGDFTPSQVLLDAGTPGVVDLDTVCWADPALDLGRFIAQLELRMVKVGGEAARPLLEDLVDTFLRGYGDTTPRAAQAAAATDRVAFYRRTTLARSALHAIRQLKERRFELAISLLDNIEEPIRRL